MSRKQAELLLAAVILTRSSAYLFSKTGLETLGTFNLLAARFLLGFVVLGIIFFRRLKHASRRDIIGGAIIGAVLGVVFLSEPVTVQGVCGALLILASLYIPHLLEHFGVRRKKTA